MNCVLDSFTEYLTYLGESTEDIESIYLLLKEQAGETGYTHSIVAFAMAWTFAEEFEVSIETYAFHKEHYLVEAKEQGKMMEYLAGTIFNSDEMDIFAVDGITNSPAIYLLIDEKHAIFDENLPSEGLPVASIQLRRRK